MASTSAHTPNRKFDVFLSFRGEDTRKNFVDHLYHSLYLSGIHTFKDDEELGRGEEISPALERAIEGSKIGLVVFSKDYASSKWCLEEVAMMVESSETKGQTLIPVFYDVDPSEVRKQTGRYGSAFEIHQTSSSAGRVERWKEALVKAANRSGYTVSDVANGHESKCIQLIIEEILGTLNHSTPIIVDDLVGIERRVEEVVSLLQMESNDVLSVGLWGMGGIGKTTVAEAVYDRISHQFEGSCFLKNVRELSKSKGLEALQEKLLSEVLRGSKRNISIGRGANTIKARLCCRRVLVVFDDVDQLEQLEALAAKHDWFGSGSRIIITTRDQHPLVTYGVTKIYEVKALEDDAAIQLFSSRAFKKLSPHENYKELSEQIVHYTAGLPLALKTLGSFLYKREMDQWEDTLSKLRKNLDRKILEVLEISYHGLDEMEKKIFLDISFFFNGKKKDFVTRILKSCDFHSDIGLSILVERSLITISNDHTISKGRTISQDRIWVHDLVQAMARCIVGQECEEPGKRSRLWLREDVRYVLAENTGTEKVKGISLKLHEPEVLNLNPESFTKMKKLRVLEFRNAVFSKGPSHLPNELRLLDWHGYPSACLPPSFEAENLVELKMCYSSLNQLWKKIKPLPKLKVIDLRHSHRLSKTPDFTAIPNLEELILEECTSLVEVHSSLGGLIKLVLLSLKGCTNLKRLPRTVCRLSCLKTLVVSGCSKLEELPEDLGHLKSLEELNVRETAIKRLPASVNLLEQLKFLSVGGCKGTISQSGLSSWFLPRKSDVSLSFVLPSLTGLYSLTELNLSDCNLNEGGIPSNFGSSLSSLKHLYLERNNFVTLPSCISELSQLESIDVSACKRLEALTELPSSIQVLVGHDCQSLISVGNLSAKRFRLLEGAYLCNCLKLLENNKWSTEDLVDMFLKSVLQGHPIFEMIIPGREIPEWFSDQYLGSEVSLQLPTDWYKEGLLGIAFAILCDSSIETETVYSQVQFFVTLYDESRHIIGRIGYQIISSNHIVLRFFPVGGFLDRLRFVYCEKATKWGMRLVYKKDVQGWKDGDGDEGSDVAAVEIKVTPLKRKRDEAQSSGSANPDSGDEN